MEKKLTCDVAVAGGGIAGVCAAIAAARHGASTILLQDRPVLGGNSSSEQRVWAVGATAMGRNRYAAESGIVGQLDLANLYRNPEGNPYIWDSILLDFALAEPNIRLYLNTTLVRTEGSDSHLERVFAYSMTEDTWLEIAASYFIDCTGDGTLGALAGAKWMRGRESREEFGESLAPEEADLFTLGNSLLFCSRDAGKPTPYRKPDFAYDIDYIHKLITENEKPLQMHTSGCDLWWLETGGRLDTLKDGQEIRLELQKLVYGIWNYIKNSGHFQADNLVLDWIGNLPAKRESRRLVGKHILTQNDITEHRAFADAVCGGGWPIDTHPPGGIYSKREACEQRDVGVYQIPLGSLESAAVDNLYYAGRNISATHLAFATARVMKTCGGMGQAVGTAAALRCKGGDLSRLQEVLLWDDLWIPGLDAPAAWNGGLKLLSASGYASFENPRVEQLHKLEKPLWIMLPAFPEENKIQLWLSGEGDYTIALYRGEQRKACADLEKLGQQQVRLEKEARWVQLQLPATEGGQLYLVLPAGNAAIGINREQIPGCVGSIGGRTGLTLVEPCFRLEHPLPWFAPEEALTPALRPESKPNQWRAALPARMELAVAPGKARQLQLIFDTDLNRDYNPIKPDYYGNGWDAMPAALVRHYRIWGKTESDWKLLAEETENHRRCVTVALPDGTAEVALEMLSAWGSAYAGLYGIRTSLPAFREKVFCLEGAAKNHPGQGTVYLAIPEGCKSSLPVVMAIHGSHRGALDYRDTPFYAQQRDIALAHGYMFACIDNGADTWGLEDGYANILRLYDHLISRYPAQPDMILWATSAGGTLAYRLAAEHPEKVRSIIGTFPVYDLEAAFRDLPSCRDAWGTEDMGDFLQKIQGKNPAQFAEKLQNMPIFLTHGDADDAVPIRDHSLRLQAEAGKHVRVAIIPGGTHGTSNMAFYGALTEETFRTAGL